MTELAAGVPGQPAETDATSSLAAATSAEEGRSRFATVADGAVDRVGEVAGDVVEKAGEVASDVVEKAGEVAGDVAERVGDAAERAAAASGRIAAQVVDRLRNNAELAAERGSTTIANEVVEKIAGIAAREVPGVYDLGGDVARVFSAVRERVGLGEHEADQGVSVRLEGRTAYVKLTIVIEYGFVVYSVTEKVRTKVIGAVENLLGLEVTAVDILVDDVHIPDTGPVGDDEQRAVGYQA